MRISSSLFAPSAVAILSTALLCSLTGPAMSQTEPRVGGVTSLPGVVVEAPKQLDRPKKPRQRAIARSTVSPSDIGCIRERSTSIRPRYSCHYDRQLLNHDMANRVAGSVYKA